MSQSAKGGPSPTLKTKKSRSARSGLLFPVGKIETQMRRNGIKRRRLGECAPVYLAAVLEYMTAELVEAAGLQVKKSKAKNKTKQGVLMISPSHIVQAVGKDEALSMVLKNVVVPGGGHYQGFNPILDKLRQEEMMRLKEQGQEGGEASMGGKRPKDPMFGQWIKLQMSLNTTANTTLNTTLHQSFDDQVEQDFKEERRRRKELSISLCDSSEDSGYSSSTRELDRAARKDLNEERRRSKLAEQEKKSRETEKADRLAKQRELAKTLAATLRYTPSA